MNIFPLTEDLTICIIAFILVLPVYRQTENISGFRVDIADERQVQRMRIEIMTGDEAVARGAYEASCHLAAAYPGTPSTEILENIGVHYADAINCRWTTNEKTALEIAAGAAFGGMRALSTMKHVGVNVAADPLFGVGMTGSEGGLVIVSADDPGCHSSQDEQDNRLFAPHAKLAMVEASDSQECKDFIKAAYEISEKFDIPVLFRMTTRICHSKSLVTIEDRQEVPVRPYTSQDRKSVV